MNEIVLPTEMKLIGRCSYSIYLIHNIVYWKIWQYSWDLHIRIILSLVITMALSAISYFWIEQKLYKRLIHILLSDK